MQKLKSLKNNLYQEVKSRKGFKILDPIHGESEKEGYELIVKNKEVKIKAPGLKGVISALNYLNAASFDEIASEEIYPRFPFRAIEPVTSDLCELFFSKAAEFSFTHIILTDLKLAELAESYGLKAIYKTKHSDLPPNLPLFYESNSHLQLSEDFLSHELQIKEMQALEHRPLFFALDASAERLKKLDLEAKISTSFVLQKFIKGNFGSSLIYKMDLESGLWPNLGVLERGVFFNSKNSSYKGVVVTSNLPSGKGFLDLNLFALSQALIRPEPIEMHVQNWFSEVRPDLNERELLNQTTKLLFEIKELKDIVREKNRDKINYEEAKAIGGKVFNDLILLEERSKKKPLYTYLKYFIKDARRILSHFLQCMNVAIPNVLREEDYKPAFYTQAAIKGGGGLRQQADILFIDKPEPSSYDSEREKIFYENTVQKKIISIK